ncbi:MAG: LamB/YcsF family protein [Acidimicrobiales bacterium]|nr:LamB/YcsF family protein [Acidimicrobiales bacterium]MCB9394555.1 LamB/YcsF family protein [Acidimicrobiaceae bacterium]
MDAAPGVIDLNADVGEGFGRWSLGDDDGLLDVISSANVACGFHAGDPRIMRHVCHVAAGLGVVVGAQASYPDLAGFGRRFVDIDPAELIDVVLYQVGALERLAAVEGTSVRYVKPHGALYNTIVHHEAQAAAVVEAMVAHGGGLALLGLPGSVVERLAGEAGVSFVAEGFADRGYTADGTLVPRSQQGALLTDPDDVAAQALRLAAAGARSICVHSDTPGAVALATAVRHAVVAAGFAVEAFA